MSDGTLPLQLGHVFGPTLSVFSKHLWKDHTRFHCRFYEAFSYAARAILLPPMITHYTLNA